MLIRNRKFVGGASVILTLVVLAIIGLMMIPSGLRRAGSLPPRLPPGPGGLLGTDSLGRSVALQMSEAVLKSLQVGLIAASLGTFLGALLGFTSGYFGGWVDALLRVFIDVFLSVPSLLFLVLIAALVKGVGVPVMALIIGAFAWASPARQSRAQVLSLKERAFVRLARLSGVSDFQIIFVELMPNMLPWLGANFVNAFLSAVLAESGLSLLGLGPQREMTLGMMIYWALSYGAILQNLWWWWMTPVATLMCLFLSLYLVHLGLDEVSNPRLQRAG
ncbi:MAG: ABC transporter permease [Anaerolineae bacterium]|nr:ABC transporter permease [Anaerolineae bacterium]MDW8100122.1 ABC transporter permease [Anaerolineae bacterium]